MDEKLSWIHRMIETGESTDTAEDLVASIKGDLSVEEVYVFTPKGDIKSLQPAPPLLISRMPSIPRSATK